MCVKTIFCVMLALKCSFTTSKLRFFVRNLSLEAAGVTRFARYASKDTG